MKSCRIFFAPIKNTGKNRKIISLATEYAFGVLGMEDIFVTIPANDKDKILIENLEGKGFENLGEDEGSITYLKEKEIIDKQENQRAMAA